MGWAGFIAAFAGFFLTHSLPLRPGPRGWAEARLGKRGFSSLYGLLSLAMLALLIHATGRAPQVVLWPTSPWHYTVVRLGMLAMCLILALTIARPNPFSFGGARNMRFDPARPGLIRTLRHPILAALALWAGLHMLPNGDLAHVILFGVLGGFAILGHRLIDARKRREMGPQRWQELRAATARAPRLHAPLSWPGLALRIAIGLAGYAALALLHPVLIGPAVL